MKLLWYVSNIYANSGYSDEARVFVDELINRKIDVKIIGRHNKKGSEKYIFQKENDPDTPIIFHTYRHGDYEIYRDQYSIVRTMLEVSKIPQAWVYKLNQMDEVWIPNKFNYNSFINSGVKRDKLFIIPSPVDFSCSNESSIFQFKSKKRFKFLSIFNYGVRHRKGFDILLKAYIETFSRKDDVCLIIKTKSSIEDIRREYNLIGNIPEIEIVNKIIKRNELLSIYRGVNCFVLPSRGEGIGRTYLDALMMGVPIIATGWSGNTDFLNKENSFLIKYKLVEIEKRHFLKYPGFYGSKWAEPDVEDLKKIMKFVYNQFSVARKKAEKGKKDVLKFKKENIVKSVMERLRNPLLKNTHEKSCLNLFERLFPIYYPDINSFNKVSQRNRKDFKNNINSCLIYGKGKAFKRAVNFIKNRVGIRQIYSCDVGFNIFNKSEYQFDIIIIAENVTELNMAYKNLIKNIDTIPIYVFY
jgi:glycosyltransferase involved in cell wall biosynthesis